MRNAGDAVIPGSKDAESLTKMKVVINKGANEPNWVEWEYER